MQHRHRLLVVLTILGTLIFTGHALAQKARDFGMRIFTYDIIIEELTQGVDEAGAEPVTKEVLLKESDFVSIHVPLLPQNRHMIGA